MNRKPVYVVANGKVIAVTSSQRKDALLFATSNKSLSQINKDKLARVKRNNQAVIQRIEEATAHS